MCACTPNKGYGKAILRDVFDRYEGDIKCKLPYYLYEDSFAWFTRLGVLDADPDCASSWGCTGFTTLSMMELPSGVLDQIREYDIADGTYTPERSEELWEECMLDDMGVSDDFYGVNLDFEIKREDFMTYISASGETEIPKLKFVEIILPDDDSIKFFYNKGYDKYDYDEIFLDCCSLEYGREKQRREDVRNYAIFIDDCKVHVGIISLNFAKRKVQMFRTGNHVLSQAVLLNIFEMFPEIDSWVDEDYCDILHCRMKIGSTLRSLHCGEEHLLGLDFEGEPQSIEVRYERDAIRKHASKINLMKKWDNFITALRSEKNAKD